MRVEVVLRYVGVVMLFIAMFMLISAGISYVSGVDSAFYPLLLSSLLTALLGAFPLIFVGRCEQITNKEGFCIVVGAWLVACVVSMFPYLIWGGEFTLVNAWFESVSGLTTTGSTVLNDVEALPRGLQFWRFATTWIGGMGVVMFALVVLPSMGRSKMMLSNVELSSMARDNYRYRSQIILQILLVVYVGLTVLSTVLLKMAGMNWFDALCHAMSACATSGFSTKNASVAYFNSPAIDTILIFTMAAAGIHFGLIYATVTGKRNNIFRSEVTRWYLGMLFVGGLLIAISLYAADLYPTLSASFRHGMFQFVSVVSTSGYATADSNTWTPFCGHHPDLRVDRLRLCGLHGRRHQGQPHGPGRKDDERAPETPAASQRRDPHPAGRRHSGQRGAALRDDLHRGLSDVFAVGDDCGGLVRRRPDDQFHRVGRFDGQRGTGIRRGRVDGQLVGDAVGFQNDEYVADAAEASGDFRSDSDLFD